MGQKDKPSPRSDSRQAFGKQAAGRRDFLKQAAGLALAGALPAGLSLAQLRAQNLAPTRLRVAAICTSFTHRSHTHVILENFLRPYLFNGQVQVPPVEVVSLYMDQAPANDMAPEVAKEYGMKRAPTIAEALCNHSGELAVDAVLSIGEHGDYPVNAKGQMEYPRKRFFDEVVAVFRRTGQSVPYFNDKHLSYRLEWCLEMAATAKELGFPLMAGSSVPLAQRIPPLEIPLGTPMTEAVSIHGGPVESYDFHGLEVLQSMVEGRAGGELGVRSVKFVDGPALWQAADAGEWSPELAAAAFTAGRQLKAKTFREQLVELGANPENTHGILLTYLDGLRGVMLSVRGGGTQWHFAYRNGAEAPKATSFFVGPWNNRNLFKALSHAIQAHFVNRRSPYPVERTLLTSCVLDVAMDSRQRGMVSIVRPELAIAYEPVDFSAMREMGASWARLGPDPEEPRGLDPTGQQLLDAGNP